MGLSNLNDGMSNAPSRSFQGIGLAFLALVLCCPWSVGSVAPLPTPEPKAPPPSGTALRASPLPGLVVPRPTTPVPASLETYHPIRAIPLPGDMPRGGLAIDPSAGLMYLVYPGGLGYCSLKDGHLGGWIRIGRHLRQAVVAPSLHRCYCIDGSAAAVLVIDLGARPGHALIKTVAVGRDPLGIAFDPKTGEISVITGSDDHLIVIDAVSNTLRGLLPLGGHPHGLADDGAGRVYAALPDQGDVIGIDLHAFAIVARWHLPTGERPEAVAVDAARHRLYAICPGQRVLSVIDTGAARPLGSLPVGTATGIAIDPVTGACLIIDRDGTLVVVGRDGSGDERSLERLQIPPDSIGPTVDPTTHGVFIIAATITDPKTAMMISRQSTPPDMPPPPGSTPVPGSVQLILVARGADPH